MPCNPNDVSFPIPDGPTGPSIPGFGVPFSLPVPTIPFPDGFPEDLLDLLNKLQLLIPPGALKPALNPNFGKDVFDAIMKLLDQFFPFLMLYKFFLPVLNLIICIIEVLCSLINPFKLIAALKRLFTQCIPEFLNLFPIFALIIMIISLLLLLLALIEYLIEQILKFVNAILRNINALIKAISNASAASVLAIAKKLGALLCIFQNLFVLLSLFDIIIQVIKDILKTLFSIPPCQDSASDGCCSPDVCPTIVKNQYTNTTGTFQYLNEVGAQTTIVLPPPFNNLNFAIRNESWQLLDDSQTIGQAFINIIDGYDVPPTIIPKPVFFPTDATYSASTDPKQAAYTIDLRVFYNPTAWGRSDLPRFIQFKDCIVLSVPTTHLSIFDNTTVTHKTGVLSIAGGIGYEDDGTTALIPFATDGVTPNPGTAATLNNFLHKADENTVSPVLLPTDGYTFSNMTYTFKPNLAVLVQKNLVTLGCDPDFALSKTFVNNVVFGNIALQSLSLNNLVFPDLAGAQACLTAALNGLRANLTIQGVALFQATTNVCLKKLQDDTKSTLGSVIGIGFNPCNSTLSLDPATQFTTKPITVTVNLNENNGLSLTAGIPADIGKSLADQITPYATFGNISNFSFDGYQAFTAQITSNDPGHGQIMVAFQNQILCKNFLPTDGSSPNHILQTLDYQFVYTQGVPGTAEGDTDGKPSRTEKVGG